MLDNSGDKELENINDEEGSQSYDKPPPVRSQIIFKGSKSL